MSWTAAPSHLWLVFASLDAGQSLAAESQSKSSSVLLLIEPHLCSPAKEGIEWVQADERGVQRANKRMREGGTDKQFRFYFLTSFIFSSFSSSSRKKVRYKKETSTSVLPPYFLCSSTVSFPPENACLLTCDKWLQVRVNQTANADILNLNRSKEQHLVFDLLGCVSEEDRWVGVAGAHLSLRPLQGREESGVQQGWFEEADPWSDITGHPEVGVLRTWEDG